MRSINKGTYLSNFYKVKLTKLQNKVINKRVKEFQSLRNITKF